MGIPPLLSLQDFNPYQRTPSIAVLQAPPYWGLRQYLDTKDSLKALEIGIEKTPEAYVEHIVEVFREIRRVLHPKGTCWLVIGDCYIMTPHGPLGAHSNDPKYPVARPRKSGEPPNRLPQDNLKHKDLVMIPARVALALQADGWYLRSAIIWQKPNCMPGSQQDRPTSSYEHIFLLTKSPKYYFNMDAIREPHNEKYIQNRSKTSFSDSKAKYSRPDRQSSFVKRYSGTVVGNPKGRASRDVWTITTKGYKGSHYAVFPLDIPVRCIKAGCPPQGVVLDPFMGSGTTALAAEWLGHPWIGFDIDPRNENLIKERLTPAKNQSMTLFKDLFEA